MTTEQEIQLVKQDVLGTKVDIISMKQDITTLMTITKTLLSKMEVVEQQIKYLYEKQGGEVGYNK